MYSFHPAMLFNKDEDLSQLPTVVTIENSFRIKQFSRMFDENKTDKNDAMRIADFLRIYRFTTSRTKEEKYLAYMPLEEFASLLQTIGKGNFKDSAKLANSIKKAICNSYRLKQMTQESVDIILGVLIFQILGIEKSIKELDKANE